MAFSNFIKIHQFFYYRPKALKHHSFAKDAFDWSFPDFKFRTPFFSTKNIDKTSKQPKQ
jgi:hypothetical protein